MIMTPLRKILAALAVVAPLGLGAFAVTSASADSTPPSGNKLPNGNARVLAKGVQGFAASSGDVAKVRPHIARFMRGAGNAHVVRGHGAAVLEALFGPEAASVAASDYGRLSGHDLLVTVAQGDVATDLVPIAPGAKVGPFRSAVTVTDAVTGDLVTVLLVGKSDPPAKDDLGRFNVAPAAVTVSAAVHAKVHGSH